MYEVVEVLVGFGAQPKTVIRSAKGTRVTGVDLIPTAWLAAFDVGRLVFPFGPVDPVGVIIGGAQIHVFYKRHDGNINVAIGDGRGF